MKTAFIVMALALVAAPASSAGSLGVRDGMGPALAGTLERVCDARHFLLLLSAKLLVVLPPLYDRE